MCGFREISIIENSRKMIGPSNDKVWRCIYVWSSSRILEGGEIMGIFWNNTIQWKPTSWPAYKMLLLTTPCLVTNSNKTVLETLFTCDYFIWALWKLTLGKKKKRCAVERHYERLSLTIKSQVEINFSLTCDFALTGMFYYMYRPWVQH